MDIIRSSGVLLHITSLPGNYGIGTLGDEAFHFARQLQKAGQSYWQVLPIGPVSPVFEYSPYASKSTFAGNLLLISLDKLKKKWFEIDIKPFDFKEDDFINFDEVVKHKMPVLKDAADLFFTTAKDDELKAMSVMMPMGVSIYETLEGEVEIAAMNIGMMSGMFAGVAKETLNESGNNLDNCLKDVIK